MYCIGWHCMELSTQYQVVPCVGMYVFVGFVCGSCLFPFGCGAWYGGRKKLCTANMTQIDKIDDLMTECIECVEYIKYIGDILEHAGYLYIQEAYLLQNESIRQIQRKSDCKMTCKVQILINSLYVLVYVVMLHLAVSRKHI